MSHLILEAKWSSRDWELLGSAEKNQNERIRRLYELLEYWNTAYQNCSTIKFRIREVDK
jgi:tRNA A37 N6-isopentenylltransferase MiaA